MNENEVFREVKRDYEKLASTTIMRLGNEYERQRKKLKIDSTRTYSQVYSIKTATKNNWIVIIGKAPSSEKFINLQTCTYRAVTYFWDDEGLRVLQWITSGVVMLYNGHVFTRYNQRMKLGLNSPVEIVKHFFLHNSIIEYDFVVKNSKCLWIGFGKDGILLGQLCNDQWVVWRTFVSRDLLRRHQEQKENKLIKKLGNETIKAFAKNKQVENKYLNQLNSLKVLTGQYKVD